MAALLIGSVVDGNMEIVQQKLYFVGLNKKSTSSYIYIYLFIFGTCFRVSIVATAEDDISVP